MISFLYYIFVYLWFSISLIRGIWKESAVCVAYQLINQSNIFFPSMAKHLYITELAGVTDSSGPIVDVYIVPTFYR